jgi:hypothetical protein
VTADAAPPARSWSRHVVVRDVIVFVACVLVAAIPTVLLLVDHDGDPSALLRVGERSASRSFVERDIPDPVLVSTFGHDGQQFYVVARTFPNLQDADGHVDRLKYRARRVLFPALVAPLPAGDATVWGMLAVNLAAIGAAGIAVSRLATRLRAPWWIGISAALSPALLISARASLADALAFSLAVWGIVLWRRHLWWAVALFTLAALARETSLVVPAACLLVGPRARERLAMLVPFGVYGVWTLAVGAWLQPSDAGSASPFGDATRQLALPFDAFRQIGPSTAVFLGVVLFVGSVAAAWHLRNALPELAIWMVLDAVVLVTAATGVAEDALNLARLTPMAIPAIALAVGMNRARAAPPTPAVEPQIGSAAADLVP